MKKNIAIIILSITTIIGFGISLIKSSEADRNRKLYEEQRKITETEKIKADFAAKIAVQQERIAVDQVEVAKKAAFIADSLRAAKIREYEKND
jgi:uncharacterized protein YxeA